MFYRFHQNNSGGSFHHDEKRGIGYEVVIEADSAPAANAAAESIGLYFYGVSEGRDCECCGSRWYEARDSGIGYYILDDVKDIKGGWGIPSYIHFKNGEIRRIDDQTR